jgi:hypothetical protein
VTPRIGAALDLFGNGRTALKASLNKYLIGVDSAAFRYGQLAPYNRVATRRRGAGPIAAGTSYPTAI